MTTRI